MLSVELFLYRLTQILLRGHGVRSPFNLAKTLRNSFWLILLAIPELWTADLQLQANFQGQTTHLRALIMRIMAAGVWQTLNASVEVRPRCSGAFAGGMEQMLLTQLACWRLAHLGQYANAKRHLFQQIQEANHLMNLGWGNCGGCSYSKGGYFPLSSRDPCREGEQTLDLRVHYLQFYVQQTVAQTTLRNIVSFLFASSMYMEFISERKFCRAPEIYHPKQKKSSNNHSWVAIFNFGGTPFKSGSNH